MDLFYLIYYISLFLAPIVLYLLLLKPKQNGAYTKPEWYSLAKALIAKSYVRKFQQDWRNDLENISDQEKEAPKEYLKDNETDSQLIYGSDTTGNYFYLKITLKSTLHAEVSIEYRSSDGKIYRLPNEPNVLICSLIAKRWKVGGLNIEILEPFRRLRITYNGLMRCCVQNYNHEVQGEIEHVKFHFLWNSGSAPLYHPQDLNIDLLTEAVTRESWRDGEWINMLGNDYGYEQYGALNGFFNAKSLKEDNFLYMPSWRRRQIGSGYNQDLRRDFFIFAIMRDGTVFSIGAKSIKMGCTQFRYGSILTSAGELFSISSNDIQLENLAENGDVPNVFTMHFLANGRSYKCVCHVNTYKTSLIRNPNKKGWISKNATAECDINSDQAKAILRFWYQTPDLFVTPLTSLECLDHRLTGGKGNSLGMLSTLDIDKFKIPEGFVITSTSFQYQLDKNPELSLAIANLQDVCCGRKEGDIQTACDDTVQIFTKIPIAHKIREQIIGKIGEFPGENWKWAVRSSGLDEDSEDLSAAGQNTSLLGCVSNEDVLKAVACCWASLFTFQSVEYRRRHGLSIDAKMGVVVQRMVPAESAGVLFTCHPSTGDPLQMVITSNYGLGESVVSGSSDPDTIILSRTHTDDVSILRSEIGAKRTQITLQDDNQGTKEEQVDFNLTQKLSISEDQALRLGEVGALLEKRFGNPRDIEWAFCEDNLYLLQSRPITSLNNWTDWELQHEFDTPIYSQKSMYTRANIGEVVKGAVTPLSQSVVMRILDKTMQTESYFRRPNPYNFGPLLISSHTMFLDMLTYMYGKVGDKLTISIQVVDLAIFGHLVLDENLLKIALERSGALRGVAALKHNLKLFGFTWNNKQIIEKVSRFNNYWEIKFRSCDSSKKMLDKIEKRFDNITTLIKYHLHTSVTSVMYQMAAMVTMAENNEKFTDEHYTDVALLLSTNSSVESAEIPVILEEITTNIKKAKKAEAFLEINPEDGMEWLQDNCPNIRKSLDEFLSNHGHRLFREFEFRENTWAMDPSIVISMLQANCISETTTKKAQGLTVEETVAKLSSPKKGLTRYILKYLVKKCREAVAGREKSKSELIRGINRFRLAYRELGQQMVLEELIPEPDLVFFLTHDELKTISRQISPELISKASKRKRQYEKWDKLQFPEINQGIPIPDTDFNLEEFEIGNGEIQLKGTPVYEGNLVARACVITDIKEAKSIQPGDILITISTDIAWSPYFPMLSGVVTELGGLISHGRSQLKRLLCFKLLNFIILGAVVAREYGLPCVVGVQNATKYFKTGNIIKLSGKTGLLELVNHSNLSTLYLDNQYCQVLLSLTQVIMYQDLGRFEEEFTNFMHRVTEVNKIVKKLNSQDEKLQNIGLLEADQYLKDSDQTMVEKLDEKNVVLKFEVCFTEAFMEEVSKDADRRYKDKLVRKEKMETFKKQASLAFRRGEYERALNCYNKAIEQIKDSCMLYNNRCLTNIKLKLYDNAISDAKFALRLDEDHLRARLFLAKAQYLNGNMKDYESTIEEAKTRHENHINFIIEFVEKLKEEAGTEDN
ncbi:phosphoenolpyruvate synthase-related [Holotrichia oblita]|uniref:Phosphoenolpyruvate synthase-related n=1 Tax=Holotrichia oblita TaxID=644536 RepID=A0ACB9SHU3_HOLOL|nr:phosphoenolpyruvate synthase-related [Holotrichia oblita]